MRACEEARRAWGDGKQAQQTTDMDRYGRADTTTADFSVTVYELIRHQGTYIARSLLPFHATDAIAILLHTLIHTKLRAFPSGSPRDQVVVSGVDELMCCADVVLPLTTFKVSKFPCCEAENGDTSRYAVTTASRRPGQLPPWLARRTLRSHLTTAREVERLTPITLRSLCKS